MSTHESYVSLETAKMLKEAGFDWKIYTGYITYEGGHVFTTNFQTPYNFNGDTKDLFSNYGGHKEVLSAPTLDVAQRWLREVKGIEVSTEIDDNQNDCRNCEWYCLYKINKEDYQYLVNEPFRHFKRFASYEEALETGIKKVLEIILEKGE